eukprot:4690615-Pleurochrysis_carterae.AAC.1
MLPASFSGVQPSPMPPSDTLGSTPKNLFGQSPRVPPTLSTAVPSFTASTAVGQPPKTSQHAPAQASASQASSAAVAPFFGSIGAAPTST